MLRNTTHTLRIVLTLSLLTLALSSGCKKGDAPSPKDTGQKAKETGKGADKPSDDKKDAKEKADKAEQAEEAGNKNTLKLVHKGKPLNISTILVSRPDRGENAVIVELFEKATTCDKRDSEGSKFTFTVADALSGDGKTPKGFTGLNTVSATTETSENGATLSYSTATSFLSEEHFSTLKSFEMDDKRATLTVEGFKLKTYNDDVDYKFDTILDGTFEAQVCPPKGEKKTFKAQESNIEATIRGVAISFKGVRLLENNELVLTTTPAGCDTNPLLNPDDVAVVFDLKEGKPEMGTISGHRILENSLSLNMLDGFNFELDTEKMTVALSGAVRTDTKFNSGKASVLDCRKKTP